METENAKTIKRPASSIIKILFFKTDFVFFLADDLLAGFRDGFADFFVRLPDLLTDFTGFRAGNRFLFRGFYPDL